MHDFIVWLCLAAGGFGLLGFLAGVASRGALFINFIQRGPRPPPPPPLTDAGETVMAVKAAIQEQIDRLTPVPGEIAASQASAVTAAEAANTQDDADSAAALTTAVDAVVAAVNPPPAP